MTFDFDFQLVEYPRMVQFRLGLFSINARAELFAPRFPHVIKATLQRSAFHNWLQRFVQWLPGPAQRLVRTAIQALWPAFGLPDCVVLKKLEKPEYTQAFENEQAMYRRLVSGQGSIVPHFYGEAVFEGVRTNVIECLPWPSFRNQPLPLMSPDEFEKRITVAIDSMLEHGHGLLHGDPKLCNILLADDGRIVFIDLESLYVAEPGKEDVFRDCTIQEFNRIYKRHLKVRRQMEEDGEPWEGEYLV